MSESNFCSVEKKIQTLMEFFFENQTISPSEYIYKNTESECHKFYTQPT
jgi:hypothetical protein